MALGADQRSVLTLVLRHGLSLALTGVVLGTIAAALVSRFLASLLFGLPALDPVTFGSAALLFTLVTLAASYVPARRAARIDPVGAMRMD